MKRRVNALILFLFISAPLPLLFAAACSSEKSRDVYAEPQPPIRKPDLASRLAPFDVRVKYSRELHVAPEGDDLTGNGSPAAPLATLNRAASLATSGTRIVLAAGVYPPAGTLPNLQGKPHAPIAIVGREGAVIDGSLAKEPIPGIHVSNPRYLVIEGLQVRNTYPHGVNIDDGGDYATPAGPVVLSELTIQNVGRGGNNDCLKLSGVDRFHVLHSTFSGCDQGEAIDMVGCHHGFISGNTFRNLPGNGVQTKGGSSDIVIHGNRFVNVARRSVNLGGHTGAPYFRPQEASFEAARIHVASNIFFRSGDTVIAFVGCVDCLAVYNTIIDPRGHVVRLLEEHPERGIGRKNRFMNNVIAFKASDVKGYVTAGHRTRSDTFLSGCNLWYARDRKHLEILNHGSDLPAEQPPEGDLAPLFVDPAGGDYRPCANSPARGRGCEMPDAPFPDYDGRPYGSPPSVGAYTAP